MQDTVALSAADKILINGVTDFWYGAQQQPGWNRHQSPKQKQWTKKWFAGGPQTDKLIKFKFQKVIEAVADGKFEHWKSDKEGRLAVIILCDQFSRNCYRGSEKAFSFDSISLNLSKHIVNSPDLYKEYKFFEKNFILMPLMHSENKADAEMCINQYQKVLDLAKAEQSSAAGLFEHTLKFANDHKAVIDKFGRYPTRNKALGRQNTEEETQYLKNATGWGQ